MSDQSPTLLGYLTQKNPAVDSTYSATGTNTKVTYGIMPCHLKRWDDFCLQSLLDTFGEVLSHPMRCTDLVDALKIPEDQAQIFREKSVNILASEWNAKVVSAALEESHRIYSSEYLNGSLSFEKILFRQNDGRCDILFLTSCEETEGNRHAGEPDWCSYQISSGRPCKYRPKLVYTNLLPGESKVGTKWHSSWHQCGNHRRENEFYKPIAQLLKYLVQGETRYGFIMTQFELVSARLSQKWRAGRPSRQEDPTVPRRSGEPRYNYDSSFGDESGKMEYTLEYQSIPWGNQGPGELTVNLALWWLNMLATQDRTIETSYSPLNGWLREDESCYINPLSGRSVSEIPQSGEEIPIQNNIKRARRKYTATAPALHDNPANRRTSRRKLGNTGRKDSPLRSSRRYRINSSKKRKPNPTTYGSQTSSFQTVESISSSNASFRYPPGSGMASQSHFNSSFQSSGFGEFEGTRRSQRLRSRN